MLVTLGPTLLEDAEGHASDGKLPFMLVLDCTDRPILLRY